VPYLSTTAQPPDGRYLSGRWGYRWPPGRTRWRSAHRLGGSGGTAVAVADGVVGGGMVGGVDGGMVGGVDGGMVVGRPVGGFVVLGGVTGGFVVRDGVGRGVGVVGGRVVGLALGAGTAGKTRVAA